MKEKKVIHTDMLHHEISINGNKEKKLKCLQEEDQIIARRIRVVFIFLTIQMGGKKDNRKTFTILKK